MQSIQTLAAAALAACLIAAGAPAQQPAPAGQPAQAKAPAQAQTSSPCPAPKQPQAKNKEEFDEIQKVADPSLTPDQRIAQAEEFIKKFEQSDLRPFAHRAAMQAYQIKNDFPKMLQHGEKVLELDPSDVLSLILLAGAIPERTRETDLDKEQRLNQAEDFAKRALSAIDCLAKPNPQMPDDDWKRVQDDARAQSHAALGLVSLQRKQYPAAEQSFKKSVEMQAQKDPIVLWRLGLTYELMKKYEQARDALKQAVALGGVKVGTRDYAGEELQRVEEFLKKRQESGAPPPAGGSPPPQPQQ